jgi:hypothetical protein
MSSKKANYVVQENVSNLPIGYTQTAIDAAVSAAQAAGNTVGVLGGVIDIDPAVYLGEYFKGDITLNSGDLLIDMNNHIIISYKGGIMTRLRLVRKIGSQLSSLNPVSFYVTISESYSPGTNSGSSRVFIRTI